MARRTHRAERAPMRADDHLRRPRRKRHRPRATRRRPMRATSPCRDRAGASRLRRRFVEHAARSDRARARARSARASPAVLRGAATRRIADQTSASSTAASRAGGFRMARARYRVRGNSDACTARCSWFSLRVRASSSPSAARASASLSRSRRRRCPAASQSRKRNLLARMRAALGVNLVQARRRSRGNASARRTSAGHTRACAKLILPSTMPAHQHLRRFAHGARHREDHAALRMRPPAAAQRSRRQPLRPAMESLLCRAASSTMPCSSTNASACAAVIFSRACAVRAATALRRARMRARARAPARTADRTAG